MDSLVGAMVGLFRTITGASPRFRVDGGSRAENLALQNIQVGEGLGLGGSCGLEVSCALQHNLCHPPAVCGQDAHSFVST